MQPEPPSNNLGIIIFITVLCIIVGLVIWSIYGSTPTDIEMKDFDISKSLKDWTFGNSQTTIETPQNWNMQFVQLNVLPKSRNPFHIRGTNVSVYTMPRDTLLTKLIIIQNGPQNPNISLLQNDIILEKIKINLTPTMNEYYIHTFASPHLFKKDDVIQFMMENMNQYKIMITCIGHTPPPPDVKTPVS